MMRKILTFLVFAALLIPFGCSYDDSNLWNEVNNLDDRVGKLEVAVQKLNDDVRVLSDLMNGKLFIQSVEDKGNGVRVIHFITPAGEQSAMEVRNGADGKDGLNGKDGADGKDGLNGKDGADGKDGKDGVDGKDGLNGKDGADGKDGETPEVSIRQDSDGNWYWTLNGSYILDANGNKVRANGFDGQNGKDGKDGLNGKDGADGKDGQNGKDGADGKDGQNGKDGLNGKDGADGKDGQNGKDGVDGKDGADAIPPAFRINPNTGNWEMSLDMGLNWVEVGTATGKDGDAFFTDAQTSADGKYAYLTLADGTVLTFEIYNEFGISFDIEKTVIQEGQTRTVSFTVTGMTPKTEVEVIGKNGWEAESKLSADGSGTITITAPDKTGYGKVIVLLSDGGSKTIMRTLTFLAGTTRASTQSVEVGTEGGSRTITVETNLDFTVSVAGDAASWLSVSESRATPTHTESFSITVQPSDSPSPRSGLLSLEAEDGTVVETVLVVQTPVSFDAADLVFRVDPSSSTNTKGVILPILDVSASDSSPVTIDWGDGAKTELTAALTTKTRYPSHVYEDNSHPYNVVVKGVVTKLNGTSGSYMAGVTEIAQWGTGNAYVSIAISNSNAITYLPAARGGEFAKVTSFSFSGNSRLVNISPDLFKGAKKVTKLKDCFKGCSALPNVPSGLFKDLTAVTDFGGVFKTCSSLTDIPSGLFEGLTAVSSVSGIFEDCSQLAEIPADFFRGVRANCNVTSAFKGCKELKTVPSGLFATLTGATSLGNMFQKCTSLTSVPADLFQPAKNSVTRLDYVFSECTSLKSIPAPLFAGFTKVTAVSYLFNKCSSLEEIPAGFFDFAENVTNFQNVFDGCKNLRKIGSGFVNNFKNGYTGTSTFSITAILRECESLTELPPVFFNEETWKRVDNMVNFMNGCKSIETIPEGFFTGLGHGVKNNAPIKIANFNSSFNGCAKLRSVPMEDLFNSPGGLLAGGFMGTFHNCGALTGKVPAYKFSVGENTFEVYPWDRASYISSSDEAIKAEAVKVFGRSSNIDGRTCFEGCTKVDGWSKIPASWGGGDDGISAKPTLRVEIVHPEGMEYHALYFDLYGTEVTHFRYYLASTEQIRTNLPRYQNSLEKMVRDNGTSIQTDDYRNFFYANINSANGAGLAFDEGDPETEYGIIILVENSKGHNISYTKAYTGARPKGSDEFEAYTGTWTVTPTGTAVEMATTDDNGNPIVIDTPVPSFDITIEPFRVDSAYTVTGWGYTKFSDKPFRAIFNKDTKAIEIWSNPKGNMNIQENYPFSKNDNPDALYSSYNVIYYGICEDPKTGQFSYQSAGRDGECYLAGNYLQALDRVMLLGQKSDYLSSPAYGDVYWTAVEAVMCMGSMSGSQYWTPVQVIRPEYVFSYKGTDLTLHHYGPYTLTRKSTARTTRTKAPAAASRNTRTLPLTVR